MSREQLTNSIPDRVNVSSRSQPSSTTSSMQSPTAVSQASAREDSRRKELIERFAQQYEIHLELVNRISILDGFEVVVLCDDSGSMNTPIHGTTTNRWDELRQLVHVLVDVYAAYDSNGVDVYFLNRPPLLKVTDTVRVFEAFDRPPNGLTPIVPALRSILQAKRMDKTAKQKLLIVIATDGVPTDSKGDLAIDELEKVMRQERTATTYVTFLACTDEPEALDYLNDWDQAMERVDVVDDYRSELAEIRKKRGPTAKFSYGEYLVKALIGSIDPTMDTMDE